MISQTPWFIWNILFMAPRISLQSKFVETMSDVSICFYRSWSIIGCLWLEPCCQAFHQNHCFSADANVGIAGTFVLALSRFYLGFTDLQPHPHSLASVWVFHRLWFSGPFFGLLSPFSELPIFLSTRLLYCTVYVSKSWTVTILS